MSGVDGTGFAEMARSGETVLMAGPEKDPAKERESTSSLSIKSWEAKEKEGLCGGYFGFPSMIYDTSSSG